MNQNTEHERIIFQTLEKEAVPLSPRYITFNGKHFPYHADTKKNIALAHSEAVTRYPLLMSEIFTALTLGTPLILDNSENGSRELKACIKQAIDASGYVMVSIDVENTERDQDTLDRLSLNALESMEKLGFYGTEIEQEIKNIQKRRKDIYEKQEDEKRNTPLQTRDEDILKRMYEEKNQRSSLLQKEEESGAPRFEIEQEQDHPFFYKTHNPKALPVGRRQIFVIEHFEKLSALVQQCISIYCGNSLTQKVEHLQLEHPWPGLIITSTKAKAHRDLIDKGMGVSLDVQSKKFSTQSETAKLPSTPVTREEPWQYSLEHWKKLPAGKVWFRLSSWLTEYAQEKKVDPKTWHALERLDRAVQTHLHLRSPQNTKELLDMLKEFVPLLAKKTDPAATKESEKVYFDLLELLEERDSFVNKVVYNERSLIFQLLGKSPQEATEEDGAILARELTAIQANTEKPRLGKHLDFSLLQRKKNLLKKSLNAAIHELLATANYPATATFLRETSAYFPHIRNSLSEEHLLSWINSLSTEDTKALESASTFLISKARSAWNEHMHIDERTKDFHYLEGRWEAVVQERLQDLPILFEYLVLSYLTLTKHEPELRGPMRTALQKTLLELRDTVDPLKLLLRNEEELQKIAARKRSTENHIEGIQPSTEEVEEPKKAQPKKAQKLEYTVKNMHVNPLTKAAPFLRASIQTMLPREWDLWTDIVHKEIVRVQKDFQGMKNPTPSPHIIKYVSRFTQAQLDLATLYFYSMQGDTSFHTAAEQGRFLDRDFLEQNILEMTDPVLHLIEQDQLDMHIKSLIRLPTVDEALRQAFEVLLIMSTIGNDQMIPQTLHIRAEFLRKYSNNDRMMKYLLHVLADGEQGSEAEKKADVRLQLLISFTFRNAALPSLPPLPEAEE